MSGHENNYDRNVQLSITGKKDWVEKAREKFDKIVDDYFENLEEEDVVLFNIYAGRPPDDPPPPPGGRD